MPGKTYKVVVLGASETGKTSIIEQALYGTHIVGTDLTPTIEDTYTASILAEKSIELFRFYDTAGLDCEKPTVPKHYYSLADAYILVFDITKYETYHCLRLLKDEMDKNKDKSKDKAPFILLLGNKSDLEHVSRQIDPETINKWISRDKIVFREVTVTNKKGLMEAFQLMASKVTCPPPRGGLSIKRFKKDNNSQMTFSATGPAADV